MIRSAGASLEPLDDPATARAASPTTGGCYRYLLPMAVVERRFFRIVTVLLPPTPTAVAGWAIANWARSRLVMAVVRSNVAVILIKPSMFTPQLIPRLMC